MKHLTQETLEDSRLTLVAFELAYSGFITVEYDNYVEVSLRNRKLGRMEIIDELDRKFEDIQFDVRSTSNCIEVRL